MYVRKSLEGVDGLDSIKYGGVCFYDFGCLYAGVTIFVYV